MVQRKEYSKEQMTKRKTSKPTSRPVHLRSFAKCTEIYQPCYSTRTSNKHIIVVVGAIGVFVVIIFILVFVLVVVVGVLVVIVFIIVIAVVLYGNGGGEGGVMGKYGLVEGQRRGERDMMVVQMGRGGRGG